MKKTILILALAVTFVTNAQQEDIRPQQDINERTAIEQCVRDKWLWCMNQLWCNCDPWDAISYQACNSAFYGQCVQESKDSKPE